MWEKLCALYARHGYLGTRLLNFDIDGAVPMVEMAAVMRRMRENPVAELAGKTVTAVRDYQNGIDGLPASNVLVYEAQGLKAIVRPSGTEPKVKVYLFARAADEQGSDRLLDALSLEMGRLIRP